MKIAVMQPYLFPYIGYFQLFHAVDKFVVFDDVNFIKKGWINRNNILINGQKYLFTIPLQKSSQNKQIKDIKVAENNDWQTKFLKSILLNYKKAPFFDETFALVKEVINSEEITIAKLILRSFYLLKEALGLQSEIIKSSTIYNNCDLKAQNRILNICKQENAIQYINPLGGVELYNKAFFRENGIELSFLKTQTFIYEQFGNEFVPYLSIIDVLMFNGFTKTKELLTMYNLE